MLKRHLKYETHLDLNIKFSKIGLDEIDMVKISNYQMCLVIGRLDLFSLKPG